MRDFEGKKERMKLNSEKIRDRERKLKVVKMGILIMLLSLIIMYFLLRIIFESGYFTISLDPAFAQESGLVMYEKLSEKHERKILKATRVDFMDNISVKWLPENIHQMGEGSHNGENYLAYTFYLENMGSDTINYWYQIIVDDVIKNVDKAIRIMIYRNGERTIYARPNEATGNAENGTEKFILNMSETILLGLHNMENIMAAIAMCEAYGVPMDSIVKSVKEFVAVEHRIEFVATKAGVDYYNDSKGTNTDAAIKAIQAMKKPTILIGGGYDKGSTYDDWIENFDGKVKLLVLIGQTKEKIAACAAMHNFNDYVFADTFEEAMEICVTKSEPGDAVLLSPACASWGMFPNYEVRGNMFKEFVNKLS